MTRTYAAYQLLRHGPLNSGEFMQITGWTWDSCSSVLKRLRKRGKVRLVSRGSGPKRSVYEVVQ